MSLLDKLTEMKINIKLQEALFEIEEIIKKFEENNPGSTLSIRKDSYLFVEEICSGKNDVMGYQCNLAPHHDGDCWSRNKGVNFVPENKIVKDD